MSKPNIRLDDPYFAGLIKEECFSKIFKYFTELAKKYLGDVHHICTNDYLKRDGVILWTDHGFFHTSNVLSNINDLLKIFKKKLSSYEMFLLLSAGIVHDFGMFVRLVEGDLKTQRRYHGRLAEIILGNLLTEGDDAEKVGLKLLDVWHIGTIARLHQTKEFKNYIKSMKDSKLSRKKPNPAADNNSEAPRSPLTYRRLAQLGGILLLADGLDIIQGRANHNIYKAFQKIIGQVNPLSSAEWLTNSLVLKYKIDAQNNGQINTAYLVDIPKVSEKLNLALDVDDAEFNKNVGEYFMSFLWRYLYDGHFRFFKKVFPKSSLKIQLFDDEEKFKNSSNKDSLVYIQTDPMSAKIPYNKEWQFWYEGLASLNLGKKVWTELNALTHSLGCEHCFILVKDNLRTALRIFVPADFLESYADNKTYILKVSWRMKNGYKNLKKAFCYKQFHYDCLRARVPEKFSVAGHVWYRGLPEIINFGEVNEGRMMADELDLSLGLKALYYHPFISGNDKAGRTLHFVLVFNNNELHNEEILPQLQSRCTEAWKAYMRGHAWGDHLSNKLDIKLDKVCNMLKERLFLGHPMVEKL